MNLKTAIPLVFLIIIIYSCEKEVTLDFGHTPKLCLNCILNPDSTITAKLTLSKKLDDSDNFISVENATVKLYEEGILFGELTDYGNGNYLLNKKPTKGKLYKIVAESIDKKTVIATTVIPGAPDVSYLKDTTGSTEYDNRIRYNLNVKIFDKPGKDNYWIFGSWLVGGVMYGGGSRAINAPFVDTFNRSVDTEAKYGFTYFLQIRISDEGYDGQELDFIIPDFVVNNQHDFFYQHFLNADEHYDKYIKTTIINKMKEDSELPFYEPVQIYSNIENGYGIFGSCATTTVKL